MTAIVAFAIICVISSSLYVPGESTRLGYEYNSDVCGSFKLHRIPATWDEARLRCYYEGGVLASPYNQSVADAMKMVIAKASPPTATVFTGIHSMFSVGDFVSVEGYPLDAMDLRWAPNEPGALGEDCILMHLNGDIADVSCNERLPYVCYRKGQEEVKDTVCGTSDKEYKYFAQTGSCYKVHRVGRTWSRGFMTCQAEGGHLAIINSETEAQVIRDLLKANPEASMFADYKHVASIGYLDWSHSGSWWTIHGQLLSEAGYATWDSRCPDHKNIQFCGGVNRSGKLNDIWCHNGTFPLICELPATSDVPLLPINQQQKK